MRVSMKVTAAILTAISMLPFEAFALDCGDVDASGAVTASDALMVLKSATGDTIEMRCGQAQTLAEVEERLTALEALLAHFTVAGDRLVISGMNLQVVNGEGATGTVNGLGNVIIGYDESSENKNDEPTDDKTGSHNLVIGTEHTYTSFGGLVAGNDNSIENEGGVVLGGQLNSATGALAVVVSGESNIASGFRSAIVGGSSNIASGEDSVIAGGTFNRSIARESFVGAGVSNDAQGFASSVTGGQFNRAVGERSSISGGSDNVALGAASSIAGGRRTAPSPSPRR